MKCPYLKKVIHKPQVYDGYELLNYNEDIQEMCECARNECPFYYKIRSLELEEHCRRAESEAIKHE